MVRCPTRLDQNDLLIANHDTYVQFRAFLVGSKFGFLEQIYGSGRSLFVSYIGHWRFGPRVRSLVIWEVQMIRCSVSENKVKVWNVQSLIFQSSASLKFGNFDSTLRLLALLPGT